MSKRITQSFMLQRLKRVLRSALVFGVFLTSPGFAQEEDIELKRDQRLQELQELQAAISIGDQRRAELASEISQIDKDRVSTNRSMIATSKKARALE